MNDETLNAAVAEAKRFLARAKAVQQLSDGRRYIGGKETAAARRSSMDLTRALADLRRSPQ